MAYFRNVRVLRDVQPYWHNAATIRYRKTREQITVSTVLARESFFPIEVMTARFLGRI